VDSPRPRGSPIEEAWAVDSPARLAEYLADLAARARQGKAPVENESSLSMIEAAGAWVEDIDSFLSSRGKDIAELSPWAAVAMIFSAGLVYE
jgi:hypothetical protein